MQTIIKKLTPPKLVEARKHRMIKKWRASNRNGTTIPNATLQELKERVKYQRTCEKYVRLMLDLIIGSERDIDKSLDLKPAEYYFRRYDVTAVECKILRNEIYSKL